MQEVTENLDADTQATIDALLEPEWMEVTGSTLNIGPLIAAKVLDAEERRAEVTEQTVAEKRHQERYAVFCGRLSARPKLIERKPHLGPMLSDIRYWEAARAGVNVADERRIMAHNQTPREWFFDLTFGQRVAVVRETQRLRALDRRFRLKNKGRGSFSNI